MQSGYMSQLGNIDVCNKQMPNYNPWQNNVFPTSVCGSGYLQNVNSEDSALEENLRNCALCGKQFQTPQIAKIHYSSKKHERKVMLTKQSTQNRVKIELSFKNESKDKNSSSADQRDSISEDDLKKCELCNKTFCNPQTARAHYDSIKHQKKAMFAKYTSKPRTYMGECKLCNKIFKGADQQNNHFKSTKHLRKAGLLSDLEQNGESESQKEAIRASKRCILCNKVFSSTDEAVKHLYSIQHKKNIVMFRINEGQVQDAISPTEDVSLGNDNSKDIANILGAQLENNQQENALHVLSLLQMMQQQIGLMPKVPTISEGRYERRSDRTSIQSNAFNCLLQNLSESLMQQQDDSRIHSNVPNRFLNDQNPPSNMLSVSVKEGDLFNSVAQGDRYLSSGQIWESDHRYQNKRDQSCERERDYQYQEPGTSNRRDYQSPLVSNRRRTRWEKNSNDDNFRDRSIQRKKVSGSNSYRQRQFNYNSHKPQKFYSNWQ